MEIVTRYEALKLGLDEYFTGKPCKYGHIAKRRIYGVCVVCQLEKSREWHEANRERSRESAKEWNRNNQERYYNNVRNWSKDNPNRRRMYGRNYYDNNKEYHRIKTILYDGRVKEATPVWIDTRLIFQVIENCPDNYEVDHIVPIRGITPDGYQVSGLHVPWNLQYLTSYENKSKGKWMTKQDYEIACSLTKDMRNG